MSLDENKGYEDHPVPTLFLRAFAKVRPRKAEAENFIDPSPEFAKGKTDSLTYPWLSFGILEQHLAKYHLHPLALAVDLSKSTEMIVRDLRKLIESKRRELKITVADRRIKEASFSNIAALDREVFAKPVKPPLLSTVKAFKASARLNLDNLIYQISNHLDGGQPRTPPKRPAVSKEVKEALDESLRLDPPPPHAKSKGAQRKNKSHWPSDKPGLLF